MRIKFDVSNVPTEVALLVADLEDLRELAERLAFVLGLDDEVDRQMLRDELYGSVAALVDRYS